MVKGKINILLLFLLAALAGSEGFAQRDSVDKATFIFEDQTLPAETRTKQALELIDKAITHPECANNGYSWCVRGFIYKEWYKTFEAQNKKSKTRLDAVDHLKKSLELYKSDTTKFASETRNSLRVALKWLGSTFYNDAVTSFDTINYKTSILNYDKYKECMLVFDPNYNIRPYEINFKNVLAGQYGTIFRNNIKANQRFFGMAEIMYKEVITLDTNNWGANYNLSMLYYNYGVDIINSMDIELPIMDVDKIQDEARELFKKALPYARRAETIKPKHRDVFTCLQGIYFSLYESEKSDEYKAKLELIEEEK